MKILSVNKHEVESLRDTPFKYIVLESQPYGLDSDHVFHVLVNDDTAVVLERDNFLKVISDTGRTIGFWQNLGAGGIFRPDKVSPITCGFPQSLCDRIKNYKPADIRVEGDTWNEILLNSNLNSEFLTSFGVSKSEDTSSDSKPKSTRRNSRKSQPKTAALNDAE